MDMKKQEVIHLLRLSQKIAEVEVAKIAEKAQMTTKNINGTVNISI